MLYSKHRVPASPHWASLSHKITQSPRRQVLPEGH